MSVTMDATIPAISQEELSQRYSDFLLKNIELLNAAAVEARAYFEQCKLGGPHRYTVFGAFNNSLSQKGWRQYRCDDHADKKWILAWSKDSDNRRVLRKYCLECFCSFGSFVSQKSVDAKELPLIPVAPGSFESDAKHADLVKTLWAEFRAKDEELETLIKPILADERRARYLAYLNTDAWYAKRRAVIERCGNLCEGCRAAPVQQVHHLSYEHLGDELLFELVGLCKRCHEKAHADKQLAGQRHTEVTR